MSLLTMGSILLDVGTLICLTGWLMLARDRLKGPMPNTDPRDGIYSRLLDTPAGQHRWSIDYQMKDITVAAQWVERFPTGLGWARCSCGVRIQDPAGGALPLDFVHMGMGRHLTEARDAGERTAYDDGTPPTASDAAM